MPFSDPFRGSEAARRREAYARALNRFGDASAVAPSTEEFGCGSCRDDDELLCAEHGQLIVELL